MSDRTGRHDEWIPIRPSAGDQASGQVYGPEPDGAGHTGDPLVTLNGERFQESLAPCGFKNPMVGMISWSPPPNKPVGVRGRAPLAGDA